jgi:hypothetical protein
MKTFKQIVEDEYASDYKVKKFMGPDGKWQERKLRPHRVDFKNSKMRGEPAQDDDRGDVGMKEETTPYWKKPSFNKRMSQMAKRERLEREKKEAEKKTVKEENMTIDEQINEVLSKDASAGDWIHDFVHSDNPKFDGKSKEKRKQMALAAYYAKQQNEQAPVAPVPDRKYIKGTPENKAYKATKKPINGHPTNVKEGTMKSFKEMVQSLDELSKGTLGSYIKKAKGSAIGSSQVMGMGSSMTGQKTQDKAERTVQKRASGINKAVDRLTEEQLDEVSEKTVALAKEIAKKHRNMTSDVSRGNVHIFNKHDDEAADRLVLSHTGKDKEGNDRFHLHRVHSSAEDSDHRNLTAAEVHKHAARHITGKSIEEEVEQIEEKSEQAKRNKTMKNMMDASRGARWKVQNKVSGDEVRDWDGKHKTPRAQNVAIGRALRNENNEQVEEGYYEKPASAYRRKGDEIGGGSSKNDVPFDGPYTKTSGTVKDKSGAVHTPMSRARDLARQAMKKQMKEDIDLFFEAKDESEYGYEGDMAISQLKTICRHAEEFMGMLKPDTDLPEWVQSKITLATDYIQTAHDYMSSEMNEELTGNQHKLDKNKNGKVDSGDLKMLRGEECPECNKAPCECSSVKESGEVESRTLSFGAFMSQLNEYNPGPGGVTRIQGRSYGAQYRDPEGEDDADDKKKQVAKSEPAVKRGRGRPAGSKSGANQKVTTGKKGSGVDYTGYKLHLPNSNR